MTILQVRQLSFSYGEVQVLKNVSMQIREGERVGLVGANGSGKSTLLRLLESEWSRTSRIALLRQDVDDDSSSARSGGENRLDGIARALSQTADVLLLDEPTNYLDGKSLEWLADQVRTYPGAVLVVSHDRYFLDETVARIVSLDDGRLQSYHGNYTAYALARQQEEERRQRIHAKYLREKADLERAIAVRRQWAEKGQAQARRIRSDAPISAKGFYGGQARRVMQGAVAMEKRLERLQAEAPIRRAAIDASLRDARRSGRVVVAAQDLGFAYETGEWLWRRAGFAIVRGDKVALVGGNGAGKTTLLRLLLGELTPSEGSLRVSPMRVGHIAQTLNRMRADETLLQTAMGDSTPDVARARSVLGHLLLGGEWVGRAVATLSGGERLRLALAKLLYEGPDILFLDEPTSNLDMIGRERLEEALIAFRGTLVLVSHDRYLLDRVCTTVLHVASGSIRYVRAGYREVMDRANETRATRLTGTVRAVEEDGNALLLLRHRQAVLADILSRPMQETEKARVTTEFIALGCEIRKVEEKCRRR